MLVIKGSRFLWITEVRTLSSRGETFLNGTLWKINVAGGDFLEIRKNHEYTYSVRHELSVFLNVNDLSSVRPAIGECLLQIRSPYQYVDEPTLPNCKKKDESFKRLTDLPSLADGMVWLVLAE